MRPRAEPVPGAGPQVPVDQYGTGPFPRSLRIPGLGQRFVVRQELLFFGGDPERLVRGGQVVVGRLDWQTIWALRSAYDSPSAISRRSDRVPNHGSVWLTERLDICGPTRVWGPRTCWVWERAGLGSAPVGGSDAAPPDAAGTLGARAGYAPAFR